MEFGNSVYRAEQLRRASSRGVQEAMVSPGFLNSPLDSSKGYL